MVYILGAGGFAREVALVAFENKITISGYLSDDPSQWESQLSFGKVQGSIESINADWIKEARPDKPIFFPGVGSPTIRKRLIDRCLALDWYIHESLISPKAAMSSNFTRANIKIGVGTVICSGVSGTVDLKVGDYVNINLNCTLGHDCTIEDYVNLSPDVNVSGNVYIEEGADIGTGTVILPNIRIGRNAIVGAGAVVTKDVIAGTTVIGVPAREIKHVNE